MVTPYLPFQFPRYSVDLDIVLPVGELSFFRKFAEELGFKLEGEHDVEQTYNGRSVVYGKRVGVRVGLDLLRLILVRELGS